MGELKVPDTVRTTYIVLRPGDTLDNAERVVRDLKREPGYDTLRQVIEPILDGAHLEHVNVLFDNKYTDMFVDDTGLLKGLPRNEVATAIYRNNTLKHHPEVKPEELTHIAGTAVLFLRRVWF
jgi:hypothetical protein